MTKHFCDVCGHEIHGKNKTSKMSGAMYEITGTVAIGSAKYTMGLYVIFTDGAGTVICKYCLLDAFSKLDDRPKPQ
jgi:hypothetical protein